MRREVVDSLKEAVKKYLADSSEKLHRGGEHFFADLDKDLHITSEDTAILICSKFPSLKRAMVFFYYQQGRTEHAPQGHWWWLLPTDSHVFGMEQLRTFKYEVEQWNLHNNK